MELSLFLCEMMVDLEKNKNLHLKIETENLVKAPMYLHENNLHELFL